MKSLIRSTDKKHLRNWKSSRAGLIARYVFTGDKVVCEVTGREFLPEVGGGFLLPPPNLTKGQTLNVELEGKGTNLFTLNGEVVSVDYTTTNPTFKFGSEVLNTLRGDLRSIIFTKDATWISKSPLYPSSWNIGTLCGMEKSTSVVMSSGEGSISTVGSDVDIHIMEVYAEDRYSGRAANIIKAVGGGNLPKYYPVYVTNTAERDALVYNSGRFPEVGLTTAVNVTRVDGPLLDADITFGTSLLNPVVSVKFSHVPSQSNIGLPARFNSTSDSLERIILVCVHNVVQVYSDYVFLGTMPKQVLNLRNVLGLQVFNLDLSSSGGWKNFACCDTEPTFDIISQRFFYSRVSDPVQGANEKGVDNEASVYGLGGILEFADIPPSPYRGIVHINSRKKSNNVNLPHVEFYSGSDRYLLQYIYLNGMTVYKNGNIVGKGLTSTTDTDGVVDLAVIVTSEGIYYRVQDQVDFYPEAIDPTLPLTKVSIRGGNSNPEYMYVESASTFVASEFVEPYGYNIGSPNRGQQGFIMTLPDNPVMPLAEATLEVEMSAVGVLPIIENKPPSLEIRDLQVMYLIDSGFEGVNVAGPDIDVYSPSFAYLTED